MKIKVTSNGSPFGTHVSLIQDDGSEICIDQIVKGVEFEHFSHNIPIAKVTLLDVNVESVAENFQLLTPNWVCIEEKDGVKFWEFSPSE